jgi:hypothetical protein
MATTFLSNRATAENAQSPRVNPRANNTLAARTRVTLKLAPEYAAKTNSRLFAVLQLMHLARANGEEESLEDSAMDNATTVKSIS